MEIKGLKKAVGDYRRANEDPYRPMCGNLMFDSGSGKVWTDVFYTLNHTQWKQYDNPNIINLDRPVKEEYGIITMKTVRKYIREHYGTE